MSFQTDLTTTQYDALLTTAIERKMLKRLRSKLVCDQFAYPGTLEVSGSAKTLRWNLMADVANADHTLTVPENHDIATTAGDGGNEITNLTISSYTATVSQYGAYTRVSDLARKAWSRSTIDEIGDAFGRAGAVRKDKLIQDVIGGGDVNTIPDGSYARINGGTPFEITTGTDVDVTSGTLASASDLNYIRGWFNQQDAEEFEGSMGGNFGVVVHGKVEQDMVADVTATNHSWVDMYKHTSEGIQKIMKYRGPGALLGCLVLRSNNVASFTAVTNSGDIRVSTGTLTVYKNLCFAQQGVGTTSLDDAQPKVKIKTPGPQTVDVPLDTFGTVGYRLWHAQARLDPLRSLVWVSP